MGQKINPLGFRIGVTEPHRSTWIAQGEKYGDLVAEDYKIRTFLKNRFYGAGIEKMHIERKGDRVAVTVFSGRPGVMIGRRGAEIENLTKELTKRVGRDVKVNVIEIRKPTLSAQLVAENIADQLVRRGSFRRAMKRGVEDVMGSGALGCSVKTSGRLGGAEIARTEAEKAGSVRLGSLSIKIDYGYATALTTYGIIGVQVWINHGKYEDQASPVVPGVK